MEFNVRLSRKYSEYEDSCTAMVLCMYGRMCSVFTGEKKEILVSFLTEDGQTADTYSSSEFEEYAKTSHQRNTELQPGIFPAAFCIHSSVLYTCAFTVKKTILCYTGFSETMILIKKTGGSS